MDAQRTLVHVRTLTTTPISTFLSGKKKNPYIELIKGDSLFDFKIGGLNRGQVL